MAQIFCIANQKGGVGKTTTTVNLAAGLAKLGKRVLMVDLDPQGNATMGCGIVKTQLEKTIYQVLLEKTTIEETIIPVEKIGFSVLPSNSDLAAVEIEMVTEEAEKDSDEKKEDYRFRLRNALNQVRDQYDFILIDCPPALSVLTVNALCAAEGIIIPMQCEYYALEGLTDLVRNIKLVAQNGLNKNLRIIGLLRVMFDPRMTLSINVSDQLEHHFGSQVFKTKIPRNVRLAEAPSHGLPAIFYDQASKGAQAYMDFSREMLTWLKR